MNPAHRNTTEMKVHVLGSSHTTKWHLAVIAKYCRCSWKLGGVAATHRAGWWTAVAGKLTAYPRASPVGLALASLCCSPSYRSVSSQSSTKDILHHRPYSERCNTASKLWQHPVFGILRLIVLSKVSTVKTACHWSTSATLYVKVHQKNLIN